MKNGYKKYYKQPNKRDYITEGYIEKIEHYLYNGLDIKDLYGDVNGVQKKHKSILDSLMKPDEQYRPTPEFDYIYVTSFGRYINAETPKQYSIRFTPNKCHLYVKRTYMDMVTHFEEFGWEFDIKQVLNNYTQYKWKHVTYEQAYKV